MIITFFTSCNMKGGNRSDTKFSGMDMQKVLSPTIPNMLSAEKEEDFPIEIRVPEDSHGVVQMSDVIDSVWYVKLGDTPSDLMSDFLQNMEIHDGRIYVRDATQKHVYVFETNGNFLYAKYPLGDGPREFRRAGSIAVDRYQNRLVIHDDGLSKVLYYTLDGE
ncbi:6-bladed beta-propeller, partial [Lunatimonas lonarensis]|uniref:6-bladed beta-propeller n=1 Tax=Lunatimonas lonarensis TaxID=1232681 RepID=UPI000561ABCA